MATRFFVAVGALLVATGAPAVVLDRPPKILEARQVGTSVRLLWAPGGNADGTLNHDVDSYTLERRIGGGAWTTIFIDDPTPNPNDPPTPPKSVYVDDLSASMGWSTFPSLRYRVTAKTHADDVATTSEEFLIAFGTLSTPLWLSEAQDGKARLAWIPSPEMPGYPQFKGYVPQKNVSGVWLDLTAPILVEAPPSSLFYIDPNTTTGTSTYRVRALYETTSGTTTTMTASRISNSEEITIQAMCEGQAPNPYPLTVI